jgi:putative transposase
MHLEWTKFRGADHLRTIKYEEVNLHDYRTVDEARQRLGAYIYFYNTERLHEVLGFRTPYEVYFGTPIFPMELMV